ncbi:MAG: GntR family transcriptional regulator [Sphingomonadaceae bacterium]
MSRASDHAYATIRAMILSGELPSGDQIREEKIAESCGVSRTPVRDALRRLEAELLIRKSPSQRSFVADWSLDDVEDSFVLRAMLEGHAAKRAAARIGWILLERLKAHNDLILNAVSSLQPDVGVFLEHNRAFHAIVLESAESARLATILGRVIEQPIVWRTAQNYGRDNLLQSHREHDELICAFERRDGDWAAAIMTGHIRRAFHAYADAHQAQRGDLEQAAE